MHANHKLWPWLGALMLALHVDAASAATNIVSEDFTGDNVTNQWVALGGACLTAGDSNTTPVSGGVGIPACVGDPYYLAGGTNPTNSNSQLPLVGLGSGSGTPDAVGQGALRLTNGGQQSINETGAIISNWTFPSNQGLQVTFTTYTYGGNSYNNGQQLSGADGIGFYLIDGSKAPSIGAFGGSLGYSCANNKNPADGMVGGYLGLGIDEFGNFSNGGSASNNDNTATGPGFSPGYIVLRGAGIVNWTQLNKLYPSYYPSSLASTVDPSKSNGQTYATTAVQQTCKYGTLWDYSTPGNPQQITAVTAPQTNTPYSCATQTTPATTYADLNSQYPDYYPSTVSSSTNNNPSTFSATKGLDKTCNNGRLYYYSSKNTWSAVYPKVSISCSTTPITTTTTTYADLTAVNSTYYPSTLDSSLKTQAVSNTCSAGYLYDYSQSGMPPDYNFINHWPVSGQIFSQENNASATRTAATAITYKLIIAPNGQLTLSYDYGNTGTFADLIPQSADVFITSSNGPLPGSFRFGFGGSTGGGTNVHEITCFEASPAARTTGAPFVPISIKSNGSSYSYTLNSNPSPVQGLVQAYTVQAGGSTASTPSWEAGALMSTYRTTPVSSSTPTASRLYSTASDGKTVTPLVSLDSAAFGSISSSAATCLGSTTTMATTTLNQAEYNIVNYTVNPSYTWSGMPSSCSSYLGTRLSGSYLAAFSTDDSGLVLGAPATAADFALTGYTTWASSLKTRSTTLLFTNNDGFLYSVDASTGALNWGWMPRPFVAQLQNYSGFYLQDNFGGKFVAADAYDGSAWATYLIGSAQQGGLWWDLKLSSAAGAAPQPSAVVPINLPSALAGATYPSANYALSGVSPTVQEAPVVRTVGTHQYAAFIVNTGSGSSSASYLVEFDVSAGVPSGSAVGSAYVAQIPAASIGGSGNYVSSNLYLDASSYALEFGTTGGRLYQMPFTGNASTDVGLIGALGTAHDTTDPVLYVGGRLINGYPYTWAASMPEATVFGIGSRGWQPLWATSNAQGYVAGTSAGSWTNSTAVTKLTSGSVISDAPVVKSGALVIPVYVPPSAGQAACNVNGNGFYDLFNVINGKFPSGLITDASGNAITGDISVGLGQAYTVSSASSSSGLLVFGGSSSSGSPGSALVFQNASLNRPVQWRVH